MTNKAIYNWLFISCFLITMMVVVGGITRLTGSGLSMVEWKPITGIIPPLTEISWQEEFAKYKTSPEYLKVNFNMSLSDFKFIYNLEFYHRLLGRVTGLVFLLPLLFFITKKQINKSLAIKLFTIFLFGAFQGAVGWYMVKSGLVKDPHVSHFRLAFHLICAFLLCGIIFYEAVKIKLADYHPQNNSHLKNHLYLILANIIIQIILGAFVAGLHAGLIYNEFPLMGGHFVPGELAKLNITNFLYDPVAVQFVHRVFAFILCGNIIFYYFKIHNNTTLNKSGMLLTFVLILQIILGILTLLWKVPILIAVIHQVTALILFLIAIYQLVIVRKGEIQYV